MEAVAAAVGQGPVMRDFRRNVASTVVILTLGTLLIAGGADWSYRGVRSWVSNKVNTNISFPLTDWQLEVRMRWVKAAPVSASISKLTSIHEYFEAKPLRTKLYSVGLMCSPRWTLAWAWLFDREPGLRLLHTHTQQHQASVMYYAKRVLQFILPDFLPLSALEAAADNSPIMQLLQGAAQLNGTLLFWLAWLLCPGLQSAYYSMFFASVSPVKTMYGVVLGLARTFVEFRAMYKCMKAAMKQDKHLVRNSLLCCYALPFVMTLQSMSVLLVLGLVFPNWILHICVVAFCLWGPPAMIALMTTAWQPDRHRPLLADAPMGNGEGGAAAAGAVDAMAALVANREEPLTAGNSMAGQDSVYWPKPLKVPEEVEENCIIPHYFICSITHSIMLEPAVTATGATYERYAILEWLKSHKRDPLTGRELRPEQISPNLALYRAIDEWIHTSQDKLKKQKQQQPQQAEEQDQQCHSHRRHTVAGHACSYTSDKAHRREKRERMDRHSYEKDRQHGERSASHRRASVDAGASSSTAMHTDQHTEL